jgi:hypothetical protein
LGKKASKGNDMALDTREIGSETVQFWDRAQVTLNQLWKDGPLVLVFLRHYG